jgi:D-glycero-D-manno-heptose 1,7-bisphosphate phosphatase
MEKKAAFLDRDGTINKNFGYVFNKSNFVWLKNSQKAIKLLNQKNFLVIVVSNQSGIARRLYNKKAVNKLHVWMNSVLKKNKAKIDYFYYSDYHPKFSKNHKNSSLRKPSPGLILRAIKKHKINIKKSFMIGDSKTDMLAAKKAYIKFIFKRKNLLDCVKQGLKKIDL